LTFTPLSYQIIPNIIFIFSVVGVLLLVLRRLPEAGSIIERQPEKSTAHEKLLAKGLPAEAFSKISTFVKFWISKIWNFVLEAKDLKPHAAAGYRMQKMFNGKLPGFKQQLAVQPITTHEVKSEQYFLDMIKLQPKNLANYDLLGKFYLEQSNFSDAGDIFEYLANHEPGNPEFQARLGYCLYQQKQFGKAAEHYQKSLALDSTQPNRYYNLGLSQEGAGDLDQAVKNFEMAISLEPTVKYYISLSNLYLKLNNGIKAREVLQKAQKLDPQNETVRTKLDKLMLPKVDSSL
jgi:tetratricopeptide (TPR) repeat protein